MSANGCEDEFEVGLTVCAKSFGHVELLVENIQHYLRYAGLIDFEEDVKFGTEHLGPKFFAVVLVASCVDVDHLLERQSCEKFSIGRI